MQTHKDSSKKYDFRKQRQTLNLRKCAVHEITNIVKTCSSSWKVWRKFCTSATAKPRSEFCERTIICNFANNWDYCFLKNFLLAYVNTDSVYVQFLEYNLKFSPRYHDCNILHVGTQLVVMYLDHFHISFSHSNFSGSVLMTSSSEVKNAGLQVLYFTLYTKHYLNEFLNPPRSFTIRHTNTLN
jgi:hypothetical protein